MKAFIKLRPETQTAMMTAYALTESELSKPVEELLETYPAGLNDREAFEAILELRSCMFMVFTADSPTDYRNDCAAYDAYVQKLNKRYGEIAAKMPPNVVEEGIGLIGALRVPFQKITYETVNTDGEHVVDVRFPQNELDSRVNLF